MIKFINKNYYQRTCPGNKQSYNCKKKKTAMKILLGSFLESK